MFRMRANPVSPECSAGSPGALKDGRGQANIFEIDLGLCDGAVPPAAKRYFTGATRCLSGTSRENTRLTALSSGVTEVFKRSRGEEILTTLPRSYS